jgi:hypothetical protein
VIRRRHAGPVTEFLSDGEGLAVPAVGLIEVPPILGHPSELVIQRRQIALLGA